MVIRSGLVSVLIINFNSAEYIERCIKTIKAQDYPQTEILVIDNGSTDGSLPIVEKMENEGQLRLIAGTNVGFSRANNLGIRESAGEFVLVLNADAFPMPGYIQKCVSAFRKNEQIGTVIGKLVSDSDTSIIDSAGIYIYREGFARDRGIGEKDNGQYDREELVDGACGAAAMYKRTMLDDIRIGEEFYDEDFFAFMEDLELSFHAAMRGWTTLYLPSAVVRHVRGGSSKNVTEFACYLNERNTRLFFRKDFRLVIGIWDQVLQEVVLLGRRLTQYKYLSANSRLKLRRELAELGQRMDQKRDRLRARDRLPAFSMAGRRSYLVSTVLRRAGVKSM